MAPAGQWDEWLPVLLARPPFAPDRRPDDAVAAIAAAPDTPRLAGILVSAGGRTALFTGGGNRTIVAREGAQVGPFAIKSIRPGEVVVSAPDGLRVLKPSFSPNNGLPAQ